MKGMSDAATVLIKSLFPFHLVTDVEVEESEKTHTLATYGQEVWSENKGDCIAQVNKKRRPGINCEGCICTNHLAFCSSMSLTEISTLISLINPEALSSKHTN